MLLEIAYFIGNERNSRRGNNLEFNTFGEFAEVFKECKKGGKHSAYFTRGGLHPMSRRNLNLAESRLLVIDGDIGLNGKNCPPPLHVHKALMGYPHVIYTTHSHTSKVNKFRCVVLTDRPMKEKDLKVNITGLLSELKAQGLGVKFVKEMKAWSQPWFMPYRDNVEDGLYEYYVNEKGEPWEVKETEAEKEDLEEKGESSTLEEMYEDIRSGKEFHSALRTISFQLVKDGVSKAHCKAQLKSLMNSSKEAGSERWLTRFNDIDRLVDGIKEEDVEQFEIKGIEEEVGVKTDLPMPPGAMGELYMTAYDSLLYQYHEVAMVSAVGLVAGIAGRRFNVMDPAPMGLNMYMTLVAGTGFGKERISKFIEYCLLSAQDGLKDYSSFYGAGSFTSAKAIYNQVMDARSQVCVASEAGLLMKVRSGNVESKTAMLLDMYSKSDRNSWTKAASFSSKDDSIPPCRAVAMTLIAESTEKSLMEAFGDSNALESGYLPRQSIFRIGELANVINRNCILKVDKSLSFRLNSLMEECSKVQCTDDSEAHELRFEKDLIEDMWSFHSDCEDMKRIGSDIGKAMATRMFVKAVKYAGICTVFNKLKGSSGCLKISAAEWEWGKAMVGYEMDTVCTNLKSMGGGDMNDAIRFVCTRMTQVINGMSTNKKCQISKLERRNNCIPRYQFEASIANSKPMKELNSTSGSIKAGYRKVLEFMEQEKAIELRNTPPTTLVSSGIGGKTRYIVLTPSFNSFCDIYNNTD